MTAIAPAAPPTIPATADLMDDRGRFGAGPLDC